MAASPTITISYVDSKGKRSTSKHNLQGTYPFDELILAGQALAQLITDITLAEITEVNVSVGIDLNFATLKLVATTFADIANKALFTVASSVSGLFSKFFFPTYAESNTLANSDVLDRADVQVAAIETLIEDGLDDGGIFISPVDSRDNNLSSVLAAREIFRRS